MHKLIDEYLNDDLIDKIYSMIIYKQNSNLLFQINYYPLCKKYIDLFYNYIINYWSFCYIDGLSIIWKIYHLCIIEKSDIIFKGDYFLNILLGNYEKYISEEIEQIYTSELLRILNNSNINIKNLLIKKYINKYIMVLKKHHLEFIDIELSIWGDISKYGYNDESLSDFKIEEIKNAYNYKAPIINNNDIYNTIL
tara:strand:- start:1533 stop:2117 length:585 start_codon:yes stop_codon:yes gene_type:complete